MNDPYKFSTATRATTEAKKLLTPLSYALVWAVNVRNGKRHIEWKASCGCAYHPDPTPHIHYCSPEHREAGAR